MAITAMYKGALFACFLGIVLAQENLPETVPSDVEESETISPVTLSAVNSELPIALTRDLKSKLYEAQVLQEQAKNAVYNFTTMLVDGITDNTQGRQETRNGYRVEGSYWYSDGFYRRTVSYIADEKGYRIVSDVSEPLGNGPVLDVNGRADVYTNIGGQESEYSITRDDIAREKNLKVLTTTIVPAAAA